MYYCSHHLSYYMGVYMNKIGKKELFSGVRLTRHQLLNLLGDRYYLEYVRNYSDHYGIYEIIIDDPDGVHSKYLYGLVRENRRQNKAVEIDGVSNGIYNLSQLAFTICDGGEDG